MRANQFLEELRLSFEDLRDQKIFVVSFEVLSHRLDKVLLLLLRASRPSAKRRPNADTGVCSEAKGTQKGADAVNLSRSDAAIRHVL